MVVHAFPAAKLGALLLKQISKPIANFIKERAKQKPFFRRYVCMPPANSVKLGALLMKQASKPIADRIKAEAKGHPFFRKYVCMPPAHFYNWCEVKMKMWILNLGKPVSVPPLNEAMAIDLGANILGEGIIFVIAAAVLYMEYTRQVRKEQQKEAARKEELSTLNYTIQELYFQVERQDAQIRELLRTISDLQTSVVKKPWKPSPLHKSSGESGGDTPPPAHPPAAPVNKPAPSHSPATITLNTANIIQSGLVKHHHQYEQSSPSQHQHHHDVIPMHLEHINKVVSSEYQGGILLSAISYLTNDIFDYKNEYYKEIHLQEQQH